MIDNRIYFDERYDCEDSNTTTLYYVAPKELLNDIVSTEYLDAVSMEISIEFPSEMIAAEYASVSASPTNKNGEDYDWSDVYVPYSDIVSLIQLAEESIA